MSLRTNPDRILENIDRQRTREEEGHAGQDRHAIGRELDITIPDIDATTPERIQAMFEQTGVDAVMVGRSPRLILLLIRPLFAEPLDPVRCQTNPLACPVAVTSRSKTMPSLRKEV